MVGGAGERIATNLPPSGSFEWIPKIVVGGSEVDGVDASGDRSYSGYIEAKLCKAGSSCYEHDGTLLAKDRNDKPFRINTSGDKPLYVKVISPNGEEIWEAGKTYTIKWDLSEIKSYETIQIGYRPTDRDPNLGDSTIATVVSNTGSYNWTIPNDIKPGKYLISLYYIPNKLFASYDYSDKAFEITDTTPVITLFSPNGRENWVIGNTYDIKWNTIGYSSDAFIQIVLKDERDNPDKPFSGSVIADTTNTGNYTWTIPSIYETHSNYKIKVVASDGNYDESDNYFGITEGGYPCFIKGTKVLMEDGSSKNIEEINKGDYVVSFNLKTGKLQKTKVLENIQRIDPSYLVINETLKPVPHQLIYTNQGFKKAEEIRIGDLLWNANEKWIKVYSVSQIIKGPVETYDLVLENANTFYADSYLVHSVVGK